MLDELNRHDCGNTAPWLSGDGLTIYWCREGPATQGLFYAALAPRAESEWDLAVLRDLDLDTE